MASAHSWELLNLRRLGTAFAAVAVVGLAAVASAQEEPAREDLEALGRDDSQWVMAPKNYANTRFSGLGQITADNVDRLQVAWTFSVGSDRGQEAAPLIVGDTLYVVGPHPNKLFALNATTGELKWAFTPPTADAAIGVACCDVVNRGAAYHDGKIIYNTLDNHTVAVDAQTGRELWHTRLGNVNAGETMTMAPLVVKDKVLVGNSGGELGVRGWLTALDVNTGEIAWRAYSTGPDEDVLIGEDFEPHYNWLKGEDLGVTSWPPDKWKQGGGTVWGWIQYDPELDFVYYGTANPGPWNDDQRPGDNLWTATIFARDPDSGMAKWAVQLNPHDLFDYDEINENILLDLEIDGETRQVLVHPGRNGYMYVIDRRTGEVLSADTYDFVNSTRGVDMETGRAIPNPEKEPQTGKTVEHICPAAPGAKDWQPSAWSPRTQLLYVPHQHLCMNWKSVEVGYIAGTPFVGAEVDMYAGPGGHRGEFMAWDPVKREKAWAIKEIFPVWSGALATAGDIAFYGTMDRWFKAVDARTGELLWKFRAPSGLIGQPVTYRGSDGRQYVAILSGVGGWPGAIAVAEIDPRVRNAALGFGGAMQDLPAYTAGGSTLLVFALPGPALQDADARPGGDAGATQREGGDANR
jgi:lanthanide-dependent methanol dehydrogenase